MAKQVHEILIDDIDGSEDAKTITFGLDGVNYEIELAEANEKSLREFLGSYVAVARKVKSRRGALGTAPGPSSGAEHRRRVAAIRAWAVENGHEVSERGRIPNEIIAAYDEAQSA
ncbi:nucleoid-associated protein Lsr2-like [Tenebrio molitor]|uniref:nucleoid-associated protein Lsr2-like n=1 Tax=Tenebrio molitor TaxID=7067 RepID=UPI00362487E9